jgi:predicted acylesterase/phospholipase RssA
MESIELSYINFPDLELYKAIAMSSAFPLIFVPVIINNDCYIDGGALNHFPLNNCLKNNYNVDEILAIKIICKDNVPKPINKESILSTYMNTLICKLFIHSYNDKFENIDNIIHCIIEDNSFIKWISAISDSKLRNDYIIYGIETAKRFLESKHAKQSKDS